MQEYHSAFITIKNMANQTWEGIKLRDGLTVADIVNEDALMLTQEDREVLGMVGSVNQALSQVRDVLVRRSPGDTDVRYFIQRTFGDSIDI